MRWACALLTHSWFCCGAYACAQAHHFLPFFRMDMPEITIRFDSFGSLLEHHLEKVHARFAHSARASHGCHAVQLQRIDAVSAAHPKTSPTHVTPTGSASWKSTPTCTC